MRLLVTGGCGFIGSNFVKRVLETREGIDITVLDLLTYAGNLANLEDVIDDPRLTFVQGDIADRPIVTEVLTGVDAVVNFAAESHVDRSIMDAGPFVRTNITGTQVLLDAVVELGVPRFVQMSTDEVYGSLGETGRFFETTPLAPNSPYSASKAAGDLLVRAYFHTHKAPVLTIRSSNAYGPYQFPEKLIPLMIQNAFEGSPLPIYGDGLNVRDWVHVTDLSDGVLTVLEDGVEGEVYNVGGDAEETNLYIVKELIRLTGASEDLIRFVPDRPGHDRRYAMDYTKISQELGWSPVRDLRQGLEDTVEWYQDNQEWVGSIQSGEYRNYYQAQYGDRLSASPKLK